MWYQRCAVWRLTPNRATTVACDAPRANRRAASNRRASSAAISCFLAMPQHGIVAHDSHHFIARGSLDQPEELRAKTLQLGLVLEGLENISRHSVPREADWYAAYRLAQSADDLAHQLLETVPSLLRAQSS
jgi:hypothetical protein